MATSSKRLSGRDANSANNKQNFCGAPGWRIFGLGAGLLGDLRVLRRCVCEDHALPLRVAVPDATSRGDLVLPLVELRQRNRAFVALTRSRLWCVAIARRGRTLDELTEARATAPRLIFPAFNQASLKRVTNRAEQGDLFAGAE